MRRIGCLALTALILLSFAAMLPLSVSAVESTTHLMVVEWYGRGSVTLNAIPSDDDSMSNPHYELLDFWWHTTIKYWINTNNRYRFSASAVINTIKAAANTWDAETESTVFAYQGTTTRSAGRRDNYNVVAWGYYHNPYAIAVTYIWYSGNSIAEIDCRMNSWFRWSLSGETGKMDTQNIMTHEFGHWCGLADLYDDVDYWLTMYGYGGYGETYKRTLGLGDILGLEAHYGP